ncbi:MAG: hypothetical protein AB1589_41500 [Cyanobacteriota bacterium]
MEKIKILFLAASSKEVNPGQEYEDIKSIVSDNLKIENIPIVSDKSIPRAINDKEAQIIHFCGHGLENGSFLFELEGEGSKGKREVKPVELASAFGDIKHINCVVLNFCYSDRASELVSQKEIEYVVGIQGLINREHAIAFSQGFYEKLKNHKALNRTVFQDAVRAGQKNLSIRGSRAVLVTYPNVLTTPDPTSKPEVQILEPPEGSKVSMKSTFKGTYKNLPEGSSIWIYVYAPKAHKYYLDPIAQAGNKRDGTWTRSGVILGGEADSGEEFIVGVLIADEEATKTLRTKEDDLDELPPEVQHKNEYVVVRE